MNVCKYSGNVKFAQNSYEIRTNFVRISHEFHVTVTEFLPKTHPFALVGPHKASTGWCSWVTTHAVQWSSFRLTLGQQCNRSKGHSIPRIKYKQCCRKFRNVGGGVPHTSVKLPIAWGGGGGRIYVHTFICKKVQITFVEVRRDRWSRG